jgi:outer membrane protein assembly factor BamD
MLPIRPAIPRTLLVGVVLLAGMVGLAGCSGFGKSKDNKRATAESLYKTAHKSMENGDYELAVRSYEALTSRFPFTDEARQGRLDIIYVYYRKGENESATDAAEQFLRENPTHPRVDYAWYMKGMVEFERQPLAIERWLGVDPAKRPPGGLQSSINAFSTVVRQYPTSAYAHDAQQRLIYLRNRLADYEMNVANYYVKRGAWDAAAQRAQRAIEQYDGAPATKQALEVLLLSYQHLGLKELEESTYKVYQLNFPDAGRQATARHAFWQFWK